MDDNFEGANAMIDSLFSRETKNEAKNGKTSYVVHRI
jgi:hypothetical protein